jgi:hypothetical protein
MEDTLITTRVSEKLKKRMKASKINWSHEIRRAIEARLAVTDRAQAIEELERLLTSVEPGFDGAAAIKENRIRG